MSLIGDFKDYDDSLSKLENLPQSLNELYRRRAIKNIILNILGLMAALLYVIKKFIEQDNSLLIIVVIEKVMDGDEIRN